MNFGHTLEERYVKIALINRTIKRFSKVFSILFALAGLPIVILVLSSKEDFSLFLLISSVLVAVSGFFVGKHIGGKMYAWAWIAFCEKYNVGGLLKSLSNASYNSAIEGYLYGGSSGAKAASAGVLIVFALLIWIYTLKGPIYAIKYRNLSKEEDKLRKQIENKYGKDCELIIK